MTTPIEYGVLSTIVMVILLISATVYAGIVAVLVVAIILACYMLVRCMKRGETTETMIFWTIAALVIAAVVTGLLANFTLGTAMLLCASAGFIVGFLFKSRGLW